MYFYYNKFKYRKYDNKYYVMGMVKFNTGTKTLDSLTTNNGAFTTLRYYIT